MAALVPLLILVLISATSSQRCPAEREDPIRSFEAQIHELVTSRGCSTEHPLVVDPSNVLKIKVHFFLKHFQFEADEEIFSIHSWVALAWNNPYLSWNPDDYGGIGDILVHSNDIWTPSLEHLNSEDDFLGKDFFSVLCSLFSEGKVVCIPRMRHAAICSSKLRNFPYDIQVCSLHFGTTDVLGPKMNFTFESTKAVSISGAEKSAGWNIRKYNFTESHVNSSNSLTITFEVEREAADLSVILITPAFVLSALTIAYLLISVKDNVRLGLLCFNTLNYFYLLQDISANLPKHSADSPTILSLVCGLMIINVFSLILTILFNKFCVRDSAPKLSFVSKIAEFMEYGLGSYLHLTPLETVDDSGDKIKPHKDWLGFCNFLNLVSFVIIVFVYILLFSCFIPGKFRNG